MTTTITGTTGVSQVQDGTIVQADFSTNVAGNGPAFDAGQGATQSPSSGTVTKLQLNTKNFDTANAFDAVTNYRFQPLIAGYYQINASVTDSGSTGPTALNVFLYKNGVAYRQGSGGNYASTIFGQTSNISCLVFLNGSTDYVEIYGQCTATTPKLAGGWVNGFLARTV